MTKEKIDDISIAFNVFQLGYIAGIATREYPDPESRPMFVKDLISKIEKVYMELQ